MSGPMGKEPLGPDADLQVARRTNWHTPPEELVANRPKFLAQIMARPVLENTAWMLRKFSQDEMLRAYEQAPAGLFSRRQWAYWGLVLMGRVDALPFPVRFPEIDRQDGVEWRPS